ncbi:SDR family NAD(P)-dependent oxidoreductase [Flavobacterium sp. MAH-1]|uniref:SDR family NAD(P)-dependent oxidoreductase n=1 Tax=Flavobacterium agri TaxID=2743471 RepID=A0A7Y9C5R4_9FLAO|nr:SDR family NAD(P)-dependent oxidoreductase [Flavobacterium agri]NUY79623.1 SDR family NAD(P)-dependent oxidoreductase [Flavobacterium agri]NYA69648.1 SDR family NAD(P)-dependent oxidoreductase [Flavobacterium agri]
MKTNKNSILITGGNVGTGLHLTRILSAMGNRVIATGIDKRSLARLEAESPNITVLFCDLSDSREVEALLDKVERCFPEVNVFIHNGGQLYLETENGRVIADPGRIEAAFLSGITISETLVATIKKKRQSAIIDLSLPTLRLLRHEDVDRRVRHVIGSYMNILRHKMQRHPNVDVPRLENLHVDHTCDPTMLAFRITETLFNRKKRGPTDHPLSFSNVPLPLSRHQFPNLFF